MRAKGKKILEGAKKTRSLKKLLTEIVPAALCKEIMLAERNKRNPDHTKVNSKGHKE